MIRYEHIITGDVFDEITLEVIDKYYADEFNNFFDEEVSGPIFDFVNTEHRLAGVVENVINEAKWDFARIIEAYPYDYYLNVYEIADYD